MRDRREGVGALHYESEQSFPTGVLLTDLDSVCAPELTFCKHHPEALLALWKTNLGKSGENEPERKG